MPPHTSAAAPAPTAITHAHAIRLALALSLGAAISLGITRFAYGLLLPPMKFRLSTDWNGGNFERLLAANIRVPDQTLGDFNAQFAAKAIGFIAVRAA